MTNTVKTANVVLHRTCTVAMVFSTAVAKAPGLACVCANSSAAVKSPVPVGGDVNIY